MTLGERIIKLREERGLTQSELARRAGLTRQCLYQHEHDRVDPKFFTITCIADALKVSLDELAGRTPHD